MKKRVLVTGAAGFIGRYTIKKLQEMGYEVIALVRPGRKERNRTVQTFEADISDANRLSVVFAQVKQCDVVIHLAANIDMEDAEGIISVNCGGTYHVITLAKQLSAKKFIYISSIPVIGEPRVLPVTEEHMVKPQTLYHISKYMGEQMVQTLCPLNMQKVILRIASPIGVGMRENNYLSVLLKKCYRNEGIELYGRGLRIQNYIDVRDIASAIVCAVEVNCEGVFLIAGKQEITNRELAFLCKEITESSVEIIWGKREDLEEKRQWIIAADKARKQLGFVPEYKLRDTIYWIWNTMREKDRCE